MDYILKKKMDDILKKKMDDIFEKKMDDTQTWMILLRKRWITPRGRPGKKKHAVLLYYMQ